MDDEKNQKKAGETKIIAFPNLGERLIVKGLDELGNRNFKAAAQLFSQAREYEPENDEVCMGLVVSLVELEYYQESKELCIEMLNKGIGDYFQLINIYLMVLLQLGEHQEMVTTIELLFEESQIPFDKEEHFEKMLQFSKRALEDKKEEKERQNQQLSEELQEDELFEGKTDNEMLLVISKLTNINIRPFIPQIEEFLQKDEGHPFFKTMLLNILIDQEYNEEVTLRKFNQSKSVIPRELKSLKETDFYKKVTGLTEEEISQDNPSLFEMVHSLIERHSFLLFPFEPGPESLPAWAAAYHALAEEYMTGEVFGRGLADLYQADEETVADILSYIKEIEEISYPII
ncbi:tetratricopeptide repeat protein [Peribacillus simplex]|uniref:Tetratricopeptide repeat protein n=2 Tax=Peribacillus TaxID=2675229 RepID=A0AA90SJD5_9BACI|nr:MULTISPECIES: tetratricopeptide repeat protein [Peribacillus]MDP1417341.1 tetratricopeptide repeat protein [Peribacillus simplex]MDP1449996.1 tetratricopeptide repeat protein [Peribacillus frigoritolerans]